MTEEVTRLPDNNTPADLQKDPREILKKNRDTMRDLGFDFNLTYYLSGPMTGHEDFNYGTFYFVSNVLRSCGLDIETPHENPWPEGHESMDQEYLWKHMMKLSYQQMDRCSGIILLNGWPQSNGARRELRHAIMKDWPVWYYDTTSNQIVNMNKPKDI